LLILEQILIVKALLSDNIENKLLKLKLVFKRMPSIKTTIIQITKIKLLSLILSKISTNPRNAQKIKKINFSNPKGKKENQWI